MLRLDKMSFIVEKNYNPQFGSRARVIEKQHGPREGCEDRVCRHCFESSDGDLERIKTCMNKCFEENQEAIYACCINSCPSIPTDSSQPPSIGYLQCAESCKNQLFGQTRHNNENIFESKRGNDALCVIL